MEADTGAELMRRLNAINQDLIQANKVMAELLLRVARRRGASDVTSTELRSVSRRLVTAGSDLTDLGVSMGVAADQRGDSGYTQAGEG